MLDRTAAELRERHPDLAEELEARSIYLASTDVSLHERRAARLAR